MARILIIRPEPGAVETAARLRALGHDPLVAPVIRLAPAPGAAPEGAEALAATSAEAVRQIAGRDIDRSLPLYAVGPGTAATALALGFVNVACAAGTAESLGRLLNRRLHAGARVLYPHGEPLSRDLSALAGSIELLPWLVYRQEPEPALAAAARDAIQAGRVDCLLAYSAFQAETFARLASGLEGLSGVTAFAMSERSALPLRDLGLAGIRIAPSTDENALLALI